MEPLIEEALHFHDAHRDRPLGSRRERLLRLLVPTGMAVRLARPVTRVVGPLQRVRAARALRGCSRLHLGSGPNHLHSWINVDVLGWRVDVAWDLCRPLPFPGGGIEAVFTEHVLEHLRFDDACRLLREAHRVLRPGGVLRVVVPDAGRFMRSYADSDGWLADLRPAASTPMMAVCDVVYRHGHRSAWDAHTLTRLLRELGFTTVRERRYGESDILPCPDLQGRAEESLYVEAIR